MRIPQTFARPTEQGNLLSPISPAQTRFDTQKNLSAPAEVWRCPTSDDHQRMWSATTLDLEN
jgi:hypothetical protein